MIEMEDKFSYGLDAFYGFQLSVIEAFGFHECDCFVEFGGFFFISRTYLADILLSWLVEAFGEVDVILHSYFQIPKNYQSYYY